jgi:hypothetical protein
LQCRVSVDFLELILSEFLIESKITFSVVILEEFKVKAKIVFVRNKVKPGLSVIFRTHM